MLSILLALTSAPTPALVVRNVDVFDGRRSELIRGATIVVEDGKFTYVGKTPPKTVPSGALEVNGSGKTMIPGLWDMHVHWYDESRLRLFTANGVTGIRIMFGMPMHLQWKKRQQEGALAAPRMYVAGPIVDGPKPIWPGSIACSNAEDGRKAVRQVKDAGYDFVKVYSLLPREAYFAIAEEAKAQKIDFEGHVPSLIRFSEAVQAGQKTAEHLYGIEVGISENEDMIMKGREEGKTSASEASLLDGHRSKKKAEAMFSTIAKAKMWQCPTLVVLRAMSMLDSEQFRSDHRLKYMAKTFASTWDPKNDFRMKSRSAADWETARKRLPITYSLIAPMAKKGVRFLAGTDCLNPYCFPGFSLHDELGLLVEAGLTPFQALQAATSGPAEFMGRRDVGIIEKGRLADFVLLDGNPLQDIHNTTRIASVCQGGQFQDRKTLDRMLNDVEARSKSE